MNKSLADLRICVERPLPHHEDVHRIIDEIKKSPEHGKELTAAFYTAKLWPSNTKEITIQFVDYRQYRVAGRSISDAPAPEWTPLSYLQSVRGNDGKVKPLDPLEEKLQGSDPITAVTTVIKERIQPMVPMDLKIVNSNGMVRISFVGKGGAWSNVGTDCLAADPRDVTMNFGWLDVPTITHELCHAMGMIHEHQNPRGNPIQWNEEAVYQWAAETQGWDRQTTYNNIIMRLSVDETNGSTFDPDSIMLYFFSPALTKNGMGVTQNLMLAKTDVDWMEKIYPGAKLSPDDFYKKIYGAIGNSSGGGNGGGNTGDGKKPSGDCACPTCPECPLSCPKDSTCPPCIAKKYVIYAILVFLLIFIFFIIKN